MSYRKLVPVLFLALAVGCASEESTTSAIKLSEVPAAVQAGVERNFPGSTITGAEKEVYKDGKVHYEIKLSTKGANPHEAEFAPDGEMLKSE